MGNCITALFHGNCRNRGGARAAGPGREWRRSAGGAGEMAEARACGKRAGRAAAQSPFDWTVGRKARSAGPQAAAAERLDGAGNIFAPCMISGPSTRKRALGGKIRAPCILNRPIAPGNECIGRRCCHLDLEKHAFRADVARKRAHFAHSAKWGCIRRDSCQPGPRGRRNARGGREWRRMVDAVHPHRRQLFAQAGKHCRNAFL